MHVFIHIHIRQCKEKYLPRLINHLVKLHKRYRKYLICHWHKKSQLWKMFSLELTSQGPNQCFITIDSEENENDFSQANKYKSWLSIVTLMHAYVVMQLSHTFTAVILDLHNFGKFEPEGNYRRILQSLPFRQLTVLCFFQSHNILGLL